MPSSCQLSTCVALRTVGLACVLLICHEVLAVEIPSHNNSDSPAASLLEQVMVPLAVNDTEQATELLDQFDRDYALKADQNDIIVAAGLRYRVAAIELKKQPNALPASRAALVANLNSRFSDLKRLIEQRISDSKSSAADVQSAQDVAALQRVTLDYARRLRSLGHFSDAISAFQTAKEIYPTRPSTIVVETTDRRGENEQDGKIILEQMPLTDAFNFTKPEKIDQEIITTAETQFAKKQTDDAKAVLLKTLNAYVADNESSPYAGVFASQAMKLEDKFDLDRLVSVYRKCEDKNHSQYVFSSLGLANLLVHANRPAEALPYLEHIKKMGIAQSRQAELHFTLGMAHFKLRNDTEAARYFLAVKKMSNNYDVDLLIKMIANRNGGSMNKLLKHPNPIGKDQENKPEVPRRP